MSGKWTWDGTQWTGGEGTPPEPKRGGSSVLKVMLGVILGGIVLIGGCGALLAIGLDEAQDESDRTSITRSQYSSAKTGQWTQSQLEARFGEPASSDEIKAEGVEGIPESDFSQNCLYYSRRGELASLYQFCFGEDGVLTTKASY